MEADNSKLEEKVKEEEVGVRETSIAKNVESVAGVEPDADSDAHSNVGSYDSNSSNYREGIRKFSSNESDYGTSEKALFYTEENFHPAIPGFEDAYLRCHVVYCRSTASKSFYVGQIYDYALWAIHDNKKVAKLTAQVICREYTKEDFYGWMCDASDDCEELAREIFDDDGKVLKKWITAPETNGLGRWTEEDFCCENKAPFVVIRHMEVLPRYRRKGIGTQMVYCLRDVAKQEHQVYIAFAQQIGVYTAPDSAHSLVPGGHAVEDDKERFWAIHGANISRGLAFYRSLAFRRVGASEWFMWISEAPEWLGEEDFDPKGSPARGEVVSVDGVPTIVPRV